MNFDVLYIYKMGNELEDELCLFLYMLEKYRMYTHKNNNSNNNNANEDLI